jgi:DUF1680 family protein
MSASHLIQAAVALSRGTGREDVLDLARRFADVAVERFGGEACEPGLNGLGTDLHHERCHAHTALLRLAVRSPRDSILRATAS